MKRLGTKSVFLGIFLTLLLAGVAVAQTGSIQGTVTDKSGAVIQGAEITVSNGETNTVRTATTNGTGGYSFPDLVPGTYEVTIKKENFKVFRATAVTLTVAQVLPLNAALEPGAVSEEVQVRGDQLPPVDLESSQVSNVVDSQKMQDLPLITRDPYSLILLSPGTIQSNSGLGGFSVNGARERDNNFLLDGSDNNDTSVPGIPSGLAALNPDATEEFRVITNNFMPEFGRNNGAIIDVVTKSGTNDLHGSAYWFGRYNALGARDYFNHNTDPVTGNIEAQNPYVRNQFGFSVGGPIIKNKTFFFVNSEWQRFRTTLTDAVRVPTAQFKTGVFTYVDPAGVSHNVNLASPASPNNLNGLSPDPIVAGILSHYPDPTIPDGNGFTGLLFFPSKSSFNAWNLTTKFDHHINERNTLSLHYDYNQSSDPDNFHDEFLPGIGATALTAHVQVAGLTWTSTIRPTMVNEAKFGFNKTNFPFNCGEVNTINSVGATDLYGRGRDYTMPLITGWGCAALGDSNGQTRSTGTWSWGDSLSVVKGAHTLKFGAEFRRVFEDGYDSFGSRDTLTFTPNLNFNIPFVNVGLDDVNFQDLAAAYYGLNDTETQSQFFDKAGNRTPTDNRKFRQHEYGFYAQDSWKVRSNLTVNFGARYEFNGVPYEVGNNFSNLFENPSGAAPDALGASNPACQAVGNGPCQAFTFSLVGPGTGHLLYNNDYGNFEPRIGFSWDPTKDGRTAIRGAFGIFHDRIFGNAFGNARGNPPFQQSPFNITLNTIENTPIPGTQPTSPYIADGFGFFPVIFAKNFPMPASANWNFGIQRELARNLVLEMNYVGVHGYHQLREVDGNPPQPSLVAQNLASCEQSQPAEACQQDLTFASLWFGGQFTAPSVNNNAFFQAALQQTTGVSYYNGLQVNLTRRFAQGLQVQAAYTFSHAIDDSSDPLVAAANNRNFPRNSFALWQERGNSDFDIRHRLVVNYIYELPFGRGKQFVNTGFGGRILEGWQISGITTYQTGHPYDVFYNRDLQHTGLSSRGVLIGSTALPAGHPKEETGLNPAGFCTEPTCAPPWGQSGVGRNQYFGPDYYNWSMVFSKNTSITERVKLQFRTEVYNLFNRTEFDQPDNALQDPTFGFSTATVSQPDGTTSARQLQFGLKLLF
jgi:Carboxypeptidase regulatory-like domain